MDLTVAKSNACIMLILRPEAAEEFGLAEYAGLKRLLKRLLRGYGLRCVGLKIDGEGKAVRGRCGVCRCAGKQKSKRKAKAMRPSAPPPVSVRWTTQAPPLLR